MFYKRPWIKLNKMADSAWENYCFCTIKEERQYWANLFCFLVDNLLFLE